MGSSSEDLCNSHLLSTVWQWAVSICFNDLHVGLSRPMIEHRGARSTTMPPRRYMHLLTLIKLYIVLCIYHCIIFIAKTLHRLWKYSKFVKDSWKVLVLYVESFVKNTPNFLVFYETLTLLKFQNSCENRSLAPRASHKGATKLERSLQLAHATAGMAR